MFCAPASRAEAGAVHYEKSPQDKETCMRSSALFRYKVSLKRQEVSIVEYLTSSHAPLLREVRAVRVRITETEIKPIIADCGICQNDSTVCGYFEGLAADRGDGGFCARCARTRGGR